MGTVFLVSRLGAGVAYPVQRPLPLSQVRCGCSFPAWGWGMAGQQGVACPPAPRLSSGNSVSQPLVFTSRAREQLLGEKMTLTRLLWD